MIYMILKIFDKTATIEGEKKCTVILKCLPLVSLMIFKKHHN
jgi:hypothetical protein